MGTFSAEFVDVVRPTATPGLMADGLVAAPRRPVGATNRKRLSLIMQSFLARGGASALTQGTLFFPEGRYVIEADAQLLRIPEALTLWMAPGAVLAPERGLVISIDGALNVPTQQVFDLSLGGLVVFGQRVDRLRPEWWGALTLEGAKGTDRPAPSTSALQQAIDAGVHNRLRVDLRSGSPFIERPLPPIPVELEGTYLLDGSVEVRGDLRGAGLREALGLPPPPATPERTGHVLIEGRGAGRAEAGATFRYVGPPTGPAALRIIECFGITVRNLAIDCPADAPPCLALVSSPSHGVGSLIKPQFPSFERCRFRGRSKPWLVQIGDRLAKINAPTDFAPTTLTPSGGQDGIDFSVARFMECDFTVEDNAIGVEFNALNSLPVRLRDARFEGTARAMIRAWGGSLHLGRCRFHNRAVPTDRQPEPINHWTLRVGFEDPDGADIYVAREPPIAGPDGALVRRQDNKLTGLLAVACVSRSGRFLSTPRPALQDPPVQEIKPQWPVVLLHDRHAPRAGMAPAKVTHSVLWGLTHSPPFPVVNGFRPMAPHAPLVIIGGYYQGMVGIWKGAVQSAVLAARSPARAGVPTAFLDVTSPGAMIYRVTDIFGLPADVR